MTKETLQKQLKNLKFKPEAGALRQERGDLMYKNLMAKINEDLTLNPAIYSPKLWFLQGFGLRNCFQYAVVTCLVFVIGITGCLTTVSASLNSLPGDTLYAIKLTTERVQLALSQDEAMKINLRTEFAGRRIDEMKTLVESSLNNKDERIKKAMSDFEVEMEGVAASLENVGVEIATGTVKFIGQKIDELNDVIVRFAPELPENIRTAAEGLGGKLIALPEDLDGKGNDVNDVNVEESPTFSSSSSVYEIPAVPEIPEAPKKIQWQIIIEE